jgi:hypothetical protein
LVQKFNSGESIMAGIFSQFKRKSTIEYKCDANEDGSIPTFTLARKSPTNDEWAKEFERVTRPYRRLIENGKIPRSKAIELNKQVFCKTLLLGWQNVQDANGASIQFSYETAMELMAHPELQDLYFTLDAECGQDAAFADEAIEGDSKN